jgi:hypothetical protein
MDDFTRSLSENMNDSEFRKIRNELYLSMLARSMAEAEEGNVIVKTIDDLEEYERSQV